MEETHQFFKCAHSEDDELLINEFDTHVTFDINPDENSPIVNLNYQDVQALVKRLNKWLND